MFPPTKLSNHYRKINTNLETANFMNYGAFFKENGDQAFTFFASVN